MQAAAVPIWSRGRAVAWLRRSRSRKRASEVLALVAITAAAAALRFWDLTSLPAGLHGDEAIAAMEGQHVLDHGSIGLYSRFAAGQPALPLYLFSPAVALFGHTVLAARVVPALAGTLTVPLMWAVMRRPFGPSAGLSAAFLLAFSPWHLHYARIGFPLETWPVVVLAIAWALGEATQRHRWQWWSVAGALIALGIYVYNGHYTVVVAAAATAIAFVLVPGRRAIRARGRRVAILAISALIVAAPMAAFAADPGNGYFDHFRRDSLTRTADWHSRTAPFGKARLLGERYLETWDRLAVHPELDGVDASGIVAPVPEAWLVLAALGVALATVNHRRRWITWFALALLLAVPLAGAMTVEGLPRRTFAMCPALAMFGGIGAAGCWELASGRGSWPWLRAFAAVLPAVVLGASAITTTAGYFDTFRDDPRQAWVFTDEFTSAVGWMNDQPPGTHFYFLSDRWSFNYETRQWLGPDLRGEDRSREFGRFGLDVNPGDAPVAFVLVGAYMRYASDLQREYPAGVAEAGGGGGAPAFFAFWPLGRPEATISRR